MEQITFEPIIPIWLMVIICIGLLAIKRRGIVPYIRQILMVLLLFAINLRPMYISDEIKVMRQKLNCYCIICIDDTLSMMAEDYNGENPRMDGVKADVEYITEHMTGAKFCLIDFNNDVNLIAPFTDDATYIKSAVNSIYPLADYHATGTNINVCKKLLGQMIDNATILGDGHVAVFFITDGENTDKHKLESFADLAPGIEGGAVMGYGTDEGGQMHYYDELYEEVVLVEDKRSFPYEPAVSYIDEDNLKQLSEDLGIPYVHMDESEDIDPVLDDVMTLLDAEQEETTKYGYADVYFWFVIPLAALVAYEFISVKRRA
ncbi:MAG: VWA domain-containing protein [Saccharofermentans sp.]|nr:VWA domain-containing protein [Saccharofermentans sp.]